MSSQSRPDKPEVSAAWSRRRFLRTAGVATGAAATGSALAACATSEESESSKGEQSPRPEDILDDAPFGTPTIAFDGVHQAGIETPLQAVGNVIAFDFNDGVAKEDVARLMRIWTQDCRALSQGETPLGSLEPEMTTYPSRLTFTLGLGAGAFDKAGVAKEKPTWLGELPKYSRDELDPAWGKSDLAVQVCGDDKLTVAYATRHLIRSAADYAHPVWLQQGFAAGAGTRPKGSTPRNLFGQIDGTVNPHTPEEYGEQVWITGETESKDSQPAWMDGSTSMIVRRIAMRLDAWEKLDRTSREVAVGRRLDNGAPLSGGEEFTPADFNATDSLGLPVIDPDSHMARATAPADHPEQKILRRPFSYELPPTNAWEDSSNSGLIFIAFQKDPLKQFHPIQKRLDQSDRLNEWIRHIGSAVYWIPPGVDRDDPARDSWWAQGLLEPGE